MRVLLAVADDNTRALVLDVLASAGHEVTSVDSGAAAVAAVERERPALCLVSDTLPDTTASALCRRLCARPRDDDAPFVVVLAHDVEGDGIAALLGAGADDFVMVTPGVPALRERVAARVSIAERHIAAVVARRRAEGTLARTQRRLGIGDASAALQHEINNPLAALLAHAALLDQGLHEPGEERELLAVIVEQAQRIGEVVKKISAQRHPDPTEFVPDDDDLVDD